MSRSEREYFNYCQELLNQDSEYLSWLDMMENDRKPMKNGGQITTTQTGEKTCSGKTRAAG